MTTSTTTTRERIVGAAFTLFGRYGFKRTSMEDIASEAGLSRAALYLQFRNKEDIFRDLAGGLHEEGLAQAAAALTASSRSSERLRAAVEAKKLRMIEITYASPHGNELIDEKNRLCGDMATDSERRFQEMLTAAFARADEARGDGPRRRGHERARSGGSVRERCPRAQGPGESRRTTAARGSLRSSRCSSPASAANRPVTLTVPA